MNRSILPRFTYHVTAIWPDGDVLAQESGVGRDAAFDEAADLITKHGCTVQVSMIERSPMTGAPVGVSDVTALLMFDRGFSPVADTACEACHRVECNCDDAFEQSRADQEAAWAAE